MKKISHTTMELFNFSNSTPIITSRFNNKTFVETLCYNSLLICLSSDREIS